MTKELKALFPDFRKLLSELPPPPKFDRVVVHDDRCRWGCAIPRPALLLFALGGQMPKMEVDANAMFALRKLLTGEWGAERRHGKPFIYVDDFVDDLKEDEYQAFLGLDKQLREKWPHLPFRVVGTFKHDLPYFAHCDCGWRQDFATRNEAKEALAKHLEEADV